MERDEDRGFLCLDWQHNDFMLFGDDTIQDFQQLEFYLLPCNYIRPGTDDRISDECVGSLQEQIDYLGHIEVFIYLNDERYQATQFGEDTFLR